MLLRWLLLIPKSSYTYSFFWIQEDIRIEELVTVIILSFPLLHKLLQVWSITYEACGNKYEEVFQPRQPKKESIPAYTHSHFFHTQSQSTLCYCRDTPAFSKGMSRPHFPTWNDTRIKPVIFSIRKAQIPTPWMISLTEKGEGIGSRFLSFYRQFIAMSPPAGKRQKHC